MPDFKFACFFELFYSLSHLFGNLLTFQPTAAIVTSSRVKPNHSPSNWTSTNLDNLHWFKGMKPACPKKLPVVGGFQPIWKLCSVKVGTFPKNKGEHNICTSVKVDGTVTMYWFILALYWPIFWGLCHVLWPWGIWNHQLDHSDQPTTTIWHPHIPPRVALCQGGSTHYRWKYCHLPR